LTRKQKEILGLGIPKVKEKNIILPPFLSTHVVYYRTLLADYHIKSDLNRDCRPHVNNSINFILILDRFCDESTSIIQEYFVDLDVFINTQEKSTSKSESESKLAEQFKQYIQQISIYISLCNHLLTRLEEKGILIDRNTFFQLRNIFIFDYETTPDEVFITQGEELPYIYIASSKVKLDVTQVNPRIAFLNQMEFFYFNKLEFLYILAENYLKETKAQL
jgi:hypothetical protein